MIKHIFKHIRLWNVLGLALVSFALSGGVVGCSDDDGGNDNTNDNLNQNQNDNNNNNNNGNPPGDLTLSHSGDQIGDGDTYNIPDNVADPQSAAVAVFSEQKDLMTLTNEGDGALTVDAVTITEGTAVMGEEFELCTADSAPGECQPYTPGTLDPSAIDDFYVHFYPVASGQRTATLQIDYTGAGGSDTITVDLIGYGRAGADDNPAYLTPTVALSWHKLWGGYDNNQDEAPGPMVADSNGNVYFAGTGTALMSGSTSDRNIFVVKVNAAGTLGWQMLYHSSHHDEIAQSGDNLGLGVADAMSIDANGYLYLVGKAANGGNQSLGLIMKIDPADGAAVWTKYWFGNTNRLQYADSAAAFALDVGTDMILITGQARADVDTQGIPVVAMDLDGNLLWSKMIVPQGIIDNAHRGHAVRLASGNTAFVAGLDSSSGSAGPFVARLSGVDAAGTSVALDWAKTLSGESAGTNFCTMDVDSADNVYLGTDRRGAATTFSVTKISADGNTVIGQTLPGTDGGLNNVYVVRVVDDALYVGGRIGITGWDTGQGDGLLARLLTADLALQWGAVYFTGTGPNEVCHHSVHGVAVHDSDVYALGQVYTGNNNFYRYWGYWYDYPLAVEAYDPTAGDVTGTTSLIEMPDAGLVDNTHNDFANDGAYESIESAVNVEFQDAPDKNESTNASAVDGDVFIMHMTESTDSTF